eukprot:GFUD01024020.1.p1 GENE.GFUD01024020.1~~GFUD01024020.1.p1  ORF type:complete len:102 (+),score=24.41 GFUD01024020.1:133-438(+)
MAKLLPVLMALSPLSVFGHGDVKHVMAGEEYGITKRQEKSISPNGFGQEVPEDKFTECVQPVESRSFHDFTTEDIEKLNNVSFSDPEYTGKVLLVVNLASF